MKEIKKLYKLLKPAIEKRLSEFRSAGRSKDRELIFAELCYCLLTPQSKAVNCWKAVTELKKRGLLMKGGKNLVSKHLKGVRFANNKASYIIEARNNLDEVMKLLASGAGERAMRSRLKRGIKGFGWKEASHFLRNTGFGENIAILDRHILKNLAASRVIKDIPKSMSEKQYKDIEAAMIKFSKKTGIPAAHLDLLLWAHEAGRIFK